MCWVEDNVQESLSPKTMLIPGLDSSWKAEIQRENLHHSVILLTQMLVFLFVRCFFFFFKKQVGVGSGQHPHSKNMHIGTVGRQVSSPLETNLLAVMSCLTQALGIALCSSPEEQVSLELSALPSLFPQGPVT